jgi:hypothetical protein
MRFLYASASTTGCGRIVRGNKRIIPHGARVSISESLSMWVLWDWLSYLVFVACLFIVSLYPKKRETLDYLMAPPSSFRFTKLRVTRPSNHFGPAMLKQNFFS